MTNPNTLNNLEEKIKKEFYAPGLPCHRERWIPDLDKIKFDKLVKFIKQEKTKAVEEIENEIKSLRKCMNKCPKCKGKLEQEKCKYCNAVSCYLCYGFYNSMTSLEKVKDKISKELK